MLWLLAFVLLAVELGANDQVAKVRVTHGQRHAHYHQASSATGSSAPKASEMLTVQA